MKECTGGAKEKQGEFDELEKPLEQDVEFIFIRLNVLREYLAKELTMENLPFPFDLERVIDDWVFMCFFVGNDFLPHLPSLEIREGAIDRLVELYKKAVYRTGGYVTNSGDVELSRVQLILTDLGEVEDEIFKRRQETELAFRARQKDRKKRMKMNEDRPAWTPGGQFSPMSLSRTPSPVQNARHEAYQMRMYGTSPQSSGGREQLESMLQPADSQSQPNSRPETPKGEKRKREDEDSDEEPEPEDDVRLWEDGWKDRYYEVKFKVNKDDHEFRHKVADAYVEGLCWVLKYYYQGCASWNWYFPYHYAPFASDFINVGDLKIKFEKGKPFKPLEQLMAVFPAASKQHVPEPWGELMTDPESPIIDFYPTDFKVDLNGKKYAWQGVALLPFVDEKRLLKALESVYPKLTEEEIKRNVRGNDRLYVRKGHKGYDFLIALYENGKNWKLEINMNPQLFSGMGGTVILSEDVIHPKETVPSPVHALPDIPGNATVCISFVDPQYPDNFKFPATRLESAVDPPKILKPGQMPVPDYRNRNNFRRPQVGMAPYNKRISLDSGGHRMLNHSLGGRNAGYGNVPPPNSYGGRDRYSSGAGRDRYSQNAGHDRYPSNAGYNHYPPSNGARDQYPSSAGRSQYPPGAGHSQYPPSAGRNQYPPNIGHDSSNTRRDQYSTSRPSSSSYSSVPRGGPNDPRQASHPAPHVMQDYNPFLATEPRTMVNSRSSIHHSSVMPPPQSTDRGLWAPMIPKNDTYKIPQNPSSSNSYGAPLNPSRINAYAPSQNQSRNSAYGPPQSTPYSRQHPDRNQQRDTRNYPPQTSRSYGRY
ncbi:5'-3' exoribonuclease 2, partial [Stegodyphus mimosarum]